MPKLILIIFIVLLVWLSPIDGARTYIVDDNGFANYKTIQEAVVAANNGDTIYVKPGIYKEEVILNKSLTIMPLLGESGPIILNGDGLQTGITITSTSCTLQGLTLQNYTGSAVSVLSDGNTIKNNVFEHVSPAILIRGANRNSINENLMKKCQGGVALRDNSNDNIIQKNEIAGSNISIFLGNVRKNSIIGNKISDTFWGIWVDSSSNIEINGNEVASKNYGILLFNSSGINVTDSIVQIENNDAISTRAILLANTSEVELKRNGIHGGAIGLGILKSLNNKLMDNTIAGSMNAVFIQDTNKQEVDNNHINEVDYGIRLDNSSQNSLKQNIIENSTIGFDIGASKQNTLIDNQISNTKDTAVQITSSSKNIFLANRITNGFRGFILSESPSNLLANNQFKNMEWGLYVESETKEGFDNSINESNVVDQVPIVYLFGKSGGQIQDKKLAHLTLAYCDNVTVKNTTITRDAVFLYDSKNIKILNNDISECFGMRLVKSFENEILGNRLLGNRYSGIFLYGSDLNQIGENNLSLNNQNGISLLSCSQNTIRDNVVESNNDTGVWLNLSNDNQIDQNNISRNTLGCQIESSTGNKIFHNNFLNNKDQSQDVNGNNSWDDGNISGGNYWGDHVAKGNPSNNWPRQIKGGIMHDRYPFQSESGWLAAKAAAFSSVAKA